MSNFQKIALVFVISVLILTNASFALAFSVNTDKISQTLESATNKISSGLKSISHKISQTSKSVIVEASKLLEKSAESAELVFNKISDELKSVMSGVSNLSEKSVESAKLAADKISDISKTKFQKISDTTKSNIQFVYNKVSVFIKNVGEGVEGGVKSVVNKISGVKFPEFSFPEFSKIKNIFKSKEIIGLKLEKPEEIKKLSDKQRLALIEEAVSALKSEISDLKTKGLTIREVEKEIQRITKIEPEKIIKTEIQTIGQSKDILASLDEKLNALNLKIREDFNNSLRSATNNVVTAVAPVGAPLKNYDVLTVTDNLNLGTNAYLTIGGAGRVGLLTILNPANSYPNLVLRASSGQTQNLLQAENSAGSTVASLDSSGNLTVQNLTAESLIASSQTISGNFEVSASSSNPSLKVTQTGTGKAMRIVGPDSNKYFDMWHDGTNMRMETNAGSGADIYIHPDGGDVYLNTNLIVSGGAAEITVTGRANFTFDPTTTSPALWLSTNQTYNDGYKTYFVINPTSTIDFDRFMHFKKGTSDIFVFDKDGNLTMAGTSTISGNLNVASNTLYVDSATGRVGIGTSTSSSLLTVGSTGGFQVDGSGNLTMAGNLAVSGTSTLAGNLSVSGNAQISGASTFATSTFNNLLTANAGLTLAGGNFEISAGNLSVSSGNLYISGTSTFGGLLSVSSGGANIAGGLTLTSGDLGITSGNLTMTGNQIITGSSTISGNLNVASNTLYVDSATGRVGIGTSTPQVKLDISAGNLNLDNTTYTNQYGVITKNGTRFIHDFNYGYNGTVTTEGRNIFIGNNAGNFTMGSTATQAYQASNNIGIGEYALKSNTTGYINIAIGTYALKSNTTGIYNVAQGTNALYYNTTGNSNTAQGVSALLSNTTGFYNVAQGTNALLSNTTGYSNIGIGYQAGRYIADGTSPNQTSNTSIYIGENTKALASGDTNEIVIGYNTTGVGSNSVVLGNDSITKTILKGSIGIGTSTPSSLLTVGSTGGFKVDGSGNLTMAGTSTISGNLNVASNTLYVDSATGRVGIGTSTPQVKLDISAGNLNLDNTTYANQYGVITKNGTRFIHDFNYGYNGTVTTEGRNIFIGNNAGNFTMGSTATQANQASDNIGIGEYALSNNTVGRRNIAIGTYALYLNTTGSENVAIGSSALQSNTTGYGNIAIGLSALNANTTGINNFAQGTNALYSNTTGSYNVAQGLNALFSNTTGTANFAQGVNTLKNNTSGSYNFAQGSSALYSNTTGSYNVAQGSSALQSNTTGNYNIAQGVSALLSNTTGYYNVAQGTNALLSNTTGYSNIGIGYQAGRYIADGTSPNQTSSYSIYIGENTKALASGDSNEIVIGYNATGAGSNSVVLGNDNITKTILKGSVGIGTTTPSSLLTVGSTGGFQVDGSGNLTMAGTSTISGNLFVGTSTYSGLITADSGSITSKPIFYGNMDTSATSTVVMQIVTDINSADNTVFKITADGQIWSDYGTTVSSPADLAERTEVVGNVSDYQIGDLVKQSLTEPKKVEKTSGEYDSGMYGVITDRGVFLGSPKDLDDSNSVKVSISGYVQIRVKGDVALGDPLTSSEIPGVAMKAVLAGRIIGFAREAHSGESIDLIEAVVQPGYFQGEPQAQLTVNGSNAAGESLSIFSLNVSNLIVSGLAQFNEGFTGPGFSLDANGKLIVKKIETEEITVKNSSVDKTGITIFDRATGSAYCVFIESGILKSEAGECANANMPNNANNTELNNTNDNNSAPSDESNNETNDANDSNMDNTELNNTNDNNSAPSDESNNETNDANDSNMDNTELNNTNDNNSAPSDESNNETQKEE